MSIAAKTRVSSRWPIHHRIGNKTDLSPFQATSTNNRSSGNKREFRIVPTSIGGTAERREVRCLSKIRWFVFNFIPIIYSVPYYSSSAFQYRRLMLPTEQETTELGLVWEVSFFSLARGGQETTSTQVYRGYPLHVWDSLPFFSCRYEFLESSGIHAEKNFHVERGVYRDANQVQYCTQVRRFIFYLWNCAPGGYHISGFHDYVRRLDVHNVLGDDAPANRSLWMFWHFFSTRHVRQSSES